MEENTVIMTSYEKIDSLTQDKLLSALSTHDPANNNYSAYMLDNNNSNAVSPERIRELSTGIHSNIKNVQEANIIIRNLIVVNDLIGKTYESLDSNINTSYNVSYKSFTEKRNKQKVLEKVKLAINDFHNQIDLPQLIRTAISLTYAEGNRILCLRHTNGTYTVDAYPLGVAEIAPYTYGNNPVVLINMRELENRLKKTYQKTRRGKALLIKDVEEDIKVNFPPEVFEGYRNKENYVRLDSQYTGVMRIGNLGRQYGVSPVFRVINLVLALENIENADFINNKAKAKKIIHQVLRKELMGTDGSRKGHGEAAHAHNELMQAWKNKTVVYTSPPYVEKIVYVEPQVEDVSADKKSSYISQIMTSLGIGFADINVANFSVANISLDQLMKTINSISEQLETIMQRWYAIVLKNNGFDMEYTPTLKIIDSEQLNFEMKKDLVDILYNKLNCSRQTAFETLGFSVEDEYQRRLAENNDESDAVFYARENAYTKSDSDKPENKGGAPTDGKNKDKQDYDKQYTEKSR